MGKKRARDSAPQEIRLCGSLTRGLPCIYGPDCKFSHDVKAFLDAKLPDLGETCYLFEKYGKCPYGLTCRYGSAHIDSETLTNIIREPAVDISEEINILSKNLQTLLRKKQYFSSKKKEAVADAPAEAVAQTHAQAEGEEPSPAAVAVTAPPAAEGAPAARAPGQPWEKGSFDISAFPLKEVKLVDFSNKVYIAPLTTVGNLPFRRVMKDFGADITCGEMALGFNINQGQSSEWALLRRHESEDVFGVQVCGGKPDMMRDTARLLNSETKTDFVDLNCGCPIDVVCDRGAGSSMMLQPNKLCNVVSALTANIHDRSVTVKIRTGWDDKAPNAHKIVPMIQKVARGKIAAIMMHGRSRLQRYTRLANWEYVLETARAQDPALDRIPVIGNGDIMSYSDWADRQAFLQDSFDGDEIGLCSCAMVGRGALIKPWLPREIKEHRHIDISASERLDMLKNFVHYGFEHWGSDTHGVAATRRFLLEWLSYLCRYAPEPLMTNPPQKINIRPIMTSSGRSDLETLLGSQNPQDWIRISEMLIGPCPEGFSFTPKHQSNSYERQSYSAPADAAAATTSELSPAGPAGETVNRRSGEEVVKDW